MEKILVQQNPHWQNQKNDGFIKRRIWPDIQRQLSLEEILILQGIRRSGKSTLFKQIINYLLENHNGREILYINFDDPYFSEILKDAKHIYKLVEIAEKVTGFKIQYLLLDEIQNVNAWEKFVKSTYDSQLFKKICLTGSNSALLAGKYATLLTGRYIKQAVYPLSFDEILGKLNLDSSIELLNNKAKVLRLQDDAIQYGQFPRIFLEKEIVSKRDILVSYLESIIQKDCISQNNIRDTKAFYQLTKYLLSNIGNLYSYASLAKLLESSDVTVKEFINILEQSYLIHELKHFNFSLKKQSRAKKKCYIADNGLISANTFEFFDRKGPLFENLVCNELIKAGFKDIFYFNDGKECDFIVSAQQQHFAIQVTYELNSNNQQREITGLLNAIERCRCNKGIIITLDQEKQFENDILALPFWKLFSNVDFLQTTLIA